MIFIYIYNSKKKIHFAETEAFCDPGIYNSDSDPKLYIIQSLNMLEAGKYAKE